MYLFNFSVSSFVAVTEIYIFIFKMFISSCLTAVCSMQLGSVLKKNLRTALSLLSTMQGRPGILGIRYTGAF